jgi:hypothetical protein
LFGLLIVDLTLSYLVLCPFQTTTGLKGARKLQNGIVVASSQGLTDSLSSITLDAAPGGTGQSSGSGSAVGTGNGFINSAAGQALASGTSGGNSSALNDLTVLGGGMTFGTLTSVGSGGGAAGGNAVFGPSFAGAIAAQTATPAPTPEPEVETVEDTGKSKGGNDKNEPVITAAPAAPTAPMFQFIGGLPTGGGGGGFGFGSGITGGSIVSPANAAGNTAGNMQFFADEAYGTSLANGFGFGVGSGVAVNNANEQAGGTGGGSSFGQGVNAFELDDAQGANFANSGSTISSGGAGAYVGLNPPNPVIFGNVLAPPSSAVP